MGPEQRPDPEEISVDEEREIEGTELQKQVWKEGTDLQKQGWELENELSENSDQRAEAWIKYSGNKNDESLKVTYEDLEKAKEEKQAELSRVADTMGEREFFDFSVKMARPEKLVDSHELAQKVAKKVKRLRDRSREMLAQAEELGKDPSKHFEARRLTYKALMLEFQAGMYEERILREDEIKKEK